MDIDDVWDTIDAERMSLAQLLEELAPHEWETRSSCSAWRVRDVAAHLTLAHMSPLTATREMVRAGGSVNRMIRDTAVRQAALPLDEFPQRLRAMVGSRRTAPGVTPLEPLIDVLVHGQDIAGPLGRDRAVPTAAAAVAATRVWSMRWPFHARRRLGGLRLVASDVPWTVGQGREVAAPIVTLLLLMTGRHVPVEALSWYGARPPPTSGAEHIASTHVIPEQPAP